MTQTPDAGRRRFFARVVTSIQAVIAGAVGVVLGGAVLSPAFARRDQEWIPAGKLGDLAEEAPVPVTVRIVREDGYRQIVDRRTVFLVRSGSEVAALDSTCTHLGCRVSWNADAKELRCPCHGGVFDHLGVVKSGPPPAPLTRLTTKVEGEQVFVQV
jgi:menaquinol-cytochrome c reductase iron-sulfur subunit